MFLKKSSLLLTVFIFCGALFALFSFFCGFYFRSGSEKHSETSSRSNRRNRIVIAIEKALPSVVNISTERILHHLYNPDMTGSGNELMKELFDSYLRSQGREKSFSLGSGFIIDSSGLVVTNAHVVERATRIVITLHNGRNYEAQVLAKDPLNDAALLKIKNPPSRLQRIRSSNSNELYLGETVIAVGNPFGLGSSISVGALSGEERKFSLRGKVIFSDILQTDAIVYPGNSGGPLINIDGNVIGMNMSSYQNAPGIGFAIPFHRVENILASWMLPERFSNCTLGVVPACDKKGNIIAAHIRKGSPAEKQGLKAGFIITGFNGEKVTDVLSLSRKLIRLKSREKVSFTTNKGVIHLQTEPEKTLDPLREAEQKLSLHLVPLTELLAKELSYPVASGMIAVRPVSDSPAGVRRGDLLVQLGKSVINTPSDLAKALQYLHYNDTVRAVFLSPVTFGGRKYMAQRVVMLRVR